MPEIPYTVVKDVLEATEKERQVYPRHTNWASMIGHPCERYLILSRTRWQEIIPPTAERLLMLEAGGAIEKHIAKPQLERAGFEVRPGKTFTWDRFQVSGRLDFEIRKNHGPWIPTEVKSMNHHDWEKINSIEDFLESKKHWIKGYPAQLIVYMLMNNSELGLFYLLSKLTYRPKEIWVSLDYTFAEDLLKKCERVNDRVREIKTENPSGDEINKFLPDPIPWDDSICGSCDLLHVCQPGRSFGQGAEVIDSQELEQKLNRRRELYPVYKEYQALDREIKKAVEGHEKLICGDWLITGRWVKRESYTVEAGEYWQVKFIPLKVNQNDEA